jgi:transglutaminase-like putative cysteine protease
VSEGFLKPGRFIDSDAPSVIAFARAQAGEGSEIERVRRLYTAVRDTILYDPYVELACESNYRASLVLAQGRGYCVGKSSLLSACARVIGVPARVGYADVRNHLTSPRLYAYLQTDLYIWHSYSELFLDGRWVKATPAFNRALCERIGVRPLEFDGSEDSLFHEFDRSGRRHMEYVRDRGPYPDVPFEQIIAEFRLAYPAIMAARKLDGDFQEEAVSGD